jgi:hypothetical protein
VPFLKRYIPDMWKNGYKGTPDEIEGLNMEDRVVTDLGKKFGLFGLPCKEFCK